MRRYRAALSLYVAVAVHLLLILLLVLGGDGAQLPTGAGRGLGGADEQVSQGSAERPLPVGERLRSVALSRDSLALAATPVDLLPAFDQRAGKLATANTKSIARAVSTRPANTQAIVPAGGGATGGGPGGYLADVRQQLSRHRHSLPGVLSNAQSEVAFRIETSGEVADVRLVQSSGVPALDAEATAVVLRAAPFPPPPDRMPRSLRVPISIE